MKNDKLPHYLKAIIVSDPELVAILNQNTKEDKNYSFDFKTTEQKTALTGVLLGSNGFELFKKILPDLIDENDFDMKFENMTSYLIKYTLDRNIKLAKK